MYSYQAYGLGFRSALPLPELLASAKAEADVIIRFGEVPFPKEITNPEHDYHFEPDNAYLSWGTIGKYQVRYGREIIIEPLPEADMEAIRLPLLGTVLALLLHQRGHFVLHGSCVSIGGKAAAFLGNKGWGKSTLAATLYRRGNLLLTDDLVVADQDALGQVSVLPGFPQFKLWPDSAEMTLGDDPESLPRLLPQYEKRSRRIDQGFSDQQLTPLSRIYILCSGDEIEIERLSPQEGLLQVITHSYITRYGNEVIKGVEGAAHLITAANVINKVSVCLLKRPSSLERINKLAQFVEDDVRACSDESLSLASAR